MQMQDFPLQRRLWFEYMYIYTYHRIQVQILVAQGNLTLCQNSEDLKNSTWIFDLSSVIF